MFDRNQTKVYPKVASLKVLKPNALAMTRFRFWLHLIYSQKGKVKNQQNQIIAVIL